MNNCKFSLIDGMYECEFCHFRTNYNLRARNCPHVNIPTGMQMTKEEIDRGISPPQAEPSLGRKMWNFGKAIGKNLLKGRICNQEEINLRLDVCKGCDHYKKVDETNYSCDLCGCPLSSLMIYRNKLALSTEECPIGKWKRLD